MESSNKTQSSESEASQQRKHASAVGLRGFYMPRESQYTDKLSANHSTHTHVKMMYAKLTNPLGSPCNTHLLIACSVRTQITTSLVPAQLNRRSSASIRQCSDRL
jgi:hypothetical protein